MNLRSIRQGAHAIRRIYGVRRSAASVGAWRPRLQSPVAGASVATKAPAVLKLHFDRFPLDRAGEKRQDPASVNALIASPDSVVVVFVDGKPVVGPRGLDATQSFCIRSGGDLLDAQGDPVEKMPWVVSIAGVQRTLRGERGIGARVLGIVWHVALPSPCSRRAFQVSTLRELAQRSSAWKWLTLDDTVPS